MEEILNGVAAEFADLSAVQAAQLAVRLLIAAALGGLIGWDRERAGKAAGVRTHLLVAVGAAGFVAVPQQAGVSPAEVTRVLQGLVAGIGFLGAGCIWKDNTEGRVEGLTTAAGLWLTAAVGAAAGMGREASALLIGLAGLFALSILGRWGVKAALGATPEGEKRPAGKSSRIATYSVLVLGVVMLLHAFHFPVPEWVSPVAMFAVIGYFLLKSVRAVNREGPAGHP